MKKIITAILITIISACVLTGCGKKDKSSADTVDSVQGDISIADEGALEQYEDNGEANDGSEEEEDISEISREDADVLISEKLAEKNCTPVYSDTEFVDGENYYTYTVLDENEDEMDQMLAVNAVSGEIFVYDLDENTVFDFSSSELYNSESDEPVSWEGSFKSGNMNLSLEPGGEDYFEFSFSGDRELTGVADAEGRVAQYEDDKVALEFIRSKNSVEVKDLGGGSDFAGNYTSN